MTQPIPVVLFAYARPTHLARVLACLRENRVPLIVAFSDGAKSPAAASSVAETRSLLRAVDWCELRLTERPGNLGLGRNVLAGVSEVAASHDAFIVWEDDLIAVPGTYAWVSAALRHHADDHRVMSVSAWTHPRVTPPGLNGAPYCDGRADCWVWGSWARAWRGMNDGDARSKLQAAVARGIAADAYGADLPVMAEHEARKNIWAVRWLYHHLARGGLCVRPPWSMVEHIGFDPQATNAGGATSWANPPLRPAPPVPDHWPEPREHAACRSLWEEEAGVPPRGTRGRLRRLVRKILPPALLDPVIARYFRVRWEGNHPNWEAAQAACLGYQSAAILERVLDATRRVRDGHATYERDGVVFPGSPPWSPVLTVLRELAARKPGPLTVLDFGGSLGSGYRRTRARLAAGIPLRWNVVEQPEFVAAGQREFAGDELNFFSTTDEAVARAKPDVILLSSVLPYLPRPLATLAEHAALGAETIVLEGTGFTRSGGNRLTVQHVPRSIYRASYPCWFLDRDELLAVLAPDYRLDAEYLETTLPPAGGEFRALVFTRAPASPS